MAVAILKVYQVNDNGSTLIEEWTWPNGTVNPVAAMIYCASGQAMRWQVPPYTGSPQRALVPADGLYFLTGYMLYLNQQQNINAVLTNTLS